MVAGGLQRLRLAGVTEAEIPESLKVVERLVTERGPGAHPMSGPIFVEGAEPGDTLEIRILTIEFLHPFGVNAFSPGGGVLPDDFPYAQLRLFRWRPGADRVEFRPGVTLPLAPFFGSIGVAPPPLIGRISSRPPGWHGGNLDNKDLVAAQSCICRSTQCCSVGDGHALRATRSDGHGARDIAAGTFEVRRERQRLRWPRAETPTHYIAMA
jgi:acetamidase/formamidase